MQFSDRVIIPGEGENEGNGYWIAFISMVVGICAQSEANIMK